MVHKIHLIDTHVIDDQYHQGGLLIEDVECVPMVSDKHALFVSEFEIERDYTSGEEEINEGEKQVRTRGNRFCRNTGTLSNLEI